MNPQRLNDFYMLDMKSLEMTEIENTGYVGGGVRFHSAIPLLPKHILFIGGKLASGNANRVKLYDVETSKWKDEEAVSQKLGSKLHYFRAVIFPRNNGTTKILCIGGHGDFDWTYLEHMVLFNVTNQQEIEIF